MPIRSSSVNPSLQSSNIGSNTAQSNAQPPRATGQQPSAPSIKLATASGIRTSTASGNLTSSMAKMKLGNASNAMTTSTTSSTALPSKYQPTRPAQPSTSNHAQSAPGRALTKQPSSATSSSSSLAPSVPPHLTVNSQGMLQGDIGTYDGGFERDMQSRQVVKGESAKVLALDLSVGP